MTNANAARWQEVTTLGDTNPSARVPYGIRAGDELVFFSGECWTFNNFFPFIYTER